MRPWLQRDPIVPCAGKGSLKGIVCRWLRTASPAKSGASWRDETRDALGTSVFGGMLAASLVGIFLIPMLVSKAEGRSAGVPSRPRVSDRQRSW
jgi:hypothetical protein